MGPPMNEPRYNASAVVLDGFIYVMGGCDVNSRTVSTVERFSHRTGYWENVISMITQRQSFGAVALNGKIYVCGGLNEHGELRDAECFDPRTWRWRSLPMMPIASAVSASSSSNSEICAVGASNPDGSYDMQVYNIKAKQWKIVKSYRKCK
ncbi:kelch repeat protein [Oesophagostomum dentatum]|uniref:Kelch repeat protein n=1 Tax=Oesophagostomum dentatum TaxID=61180 RepID=A0A0B1SI23_OESDE|nr:kelch repeat protein [Oesophagostomum dentatum]